MGIEDDWKPEKSAVRSGDRYKPGKDQEQKVIELPSQTSQKVDKPVNPGKHPYHRLVELAHLTDEHRQEFKTKRGFNDETIDTFMFRSGGDYIKNVVEQLKQEYAHDDLLKVGILKEVNGTLIVENQLLDGRILIPYIDKNLQVYHLRPHKLGFKGIPVQPYCSYFLKEKPKKIILTEGEFKTTALWQWGIPGLGIPGVPSFGRDNLDRLVKFLKEFGIEEIVVIFDSEEKGNPAFSNFKEKIEDRYDTQYWSYLMAYKLNKAGFIVSVGWLPPSWRENGKIDFDGALAQGRTKRDIEKVINDAKEHKEFLSNLSEEAQKILRRKINRHFAKTNIKREFNKYMTTVTPQKGGESYEKTLSNFVVNIKANFYNGDMAIRNVELVNEYGDSSDIIPLEPGQMAGVNEFKKFLLSRGNYLFEGTATDLMNIWKYEFLHNDGEFVYMPPQIGWVENYRLWLFANMAIKDGKVYKPDNDGIIWIEGKGYKPQSFSTDSNQVSLSSIPSLSEKQLNIMDIAEHMRLSFGGYEAYVALGWAAASVFSKDIFAKYKCFPILFLHGKRGAGKSTAMRWIMQFFGIETEGISIGETTTPNFLARAMAYYGSLGLWLDEYRNDQHCVKKDGLLRSAYNRQISGKGTATAFQARGFSVNSTVAIAGEEMTKDNGLFTRLVPIQFSSYKRNREYFDWLNKHSEYFSGFTYRLITNYDFYKEKLMKAIEDLKIALIEKGITDRTAENWAICVAAFEVTVLEDENFVQWVEKMCQEIKLTGEQEHMLNQFWDDINYLVTEEAVTEKHIKVDGDNLYIWFPALYEIWGLHYKKKTGREPFDKSSILKYLQEEPYYVKVELKRINKTPRKCHVINISQATDAIKEIVGYLDIYNKNTNSEENVT